MRDIQGTNDRVYGGDPRYIHVADGKRADFGIEMAEKLNRLMRENTENRTDEERITQPLCPGCYMVVGFDMLVTLADANGQDRRELAKAMMIAFHKLYANPSKGSIEEIEIFLDPEDTECSGPITSNFLPDNWLDSGETDLNPVEDIQGHD